jgi:nanoRNase/pAp phosphatase (c-di-AMP/oligoRNAs hydrolase)
VEPPNLEGCRQRGAPKLQELRQLARGKKTLLAQTHDFPDPDSIASALALSWLLGELEGIEGTVGYGGIVGRAENKAMTRTLGIKMKRVTKCDFQKYDLVALLDTQPEVGNHSVPPERTPDIVVDHHFPRELEGGVPPFFDVGGQYGATSTKVTELLIAAGLEPPTQIATALFYGIKSDTLNLARETSNADLTAYLYLLPLIDTRTLADIEHPQVPLDYFRILNKAIQRGKIYGTMIVSDLGEIYAPDLCAEVAERLLQVEGTRHALVLGWFEEALFLSLRTRSRNKNAGRIMHGLICGAGLGTAGGHGPTAGARLPVADKSQRARSDLRRRVVHQLVHAFGQDTRHFSRILGDREMEASRDQAPPPPKGAIEVKRVKNGVPKTGEKKPLNGSWIDDSEQDQPRTLNIP